MGIDTPGSTQAAALLDPIVAKSRLEKWMPCCSPVLPQALLHQPLAGPMGCTELPGLQVWFWKESQASVLEVTHHCVVYNLWFTTTVKRSLAAFYWNACSNQLVADIL